MATDWLCLYYDYAHAVDDVIDDGLWGDTDAVLRLFIMALDVYSHPFYLAHRGALQMPVMLSTSFYGDSVVWEKAPELWKRQWAEVLRHAGNDVIMAVAMLCGGWKHMRSLSASWLATCYVYHKDKYGIPQ